MIEKTLGQVAYEEYCNAPTTMEPDDWQAVADAVVAAHEARRWKPIESEKNALVRLEEWLAGHPLNRVLAMESTAGPRVNLTSAMQLEYEHPLGDGFEVKLMPRGARGYAYGVGRTLADAISNALTDAIPAPPKEGEYGEVSR